MISTYDIYFRFRGRDLKAYVQIMDEHSCFVNLTDSELLKDFGGQFKFSLPGKTCTPFVRNKDAKDSLELVRALAAQLKD